MDAANRWAQAVRLLRARRYRDAWPLYEARREIPAFGIPRPESSAPEWRGEDLAGRRIVICGEQGYGDQMMFGRWLPLLRETGAEIVVACDPRALTRFYAAAGFATTPLWTDRPLLPCDYWALIGSLPRLLERPEPPAARYVPLRLSGGGGIGVMPFGSPTNRNDANRSLPPEAAQRLRELGVELSREALGVRDFHGIAEHVAGLDLVRSVDTAAAHLAGAIGKSCWVLLPNIGLEWRWNDAVRSDWYPDFRFFPKGPDESWDGVVDRVTEALRGASIDHLQHMVGHPTVSPGHGRH